ncbi:MAG: PIN domain-containing protein [Coriobacteriia bacterium]|nr:PIN domain-containing protein [Coriobacteriia bacterium]
MKTVVFDTNVLLTDPNVLFEYENADIVIPETVLSELDKLKTARVDPDLRFRGREVSRLIFELAEGQSLIEGVEIGDGSTLRVAPLEFGSNKLPEGFTTKSADERILATAYLTEHELPEDAEFVLVTNDLNMLLKAQALELPVKQFGTGNDVSFAKRYVLRPFQRYRVPLTILALAVAVFGAVAYVSLRMVENNASHTPSSAEFRNLLTADQKEAYNDLIALQQNASDEKALLGLAKFFSDRAEQNGDMGDRVAMINDAKEGITYFERYLGYVPSDIDARAEMSKLFFYTGDTDRAIQEVAQVLEVNANHVEANFWLGVFYWQGRQDTQAAIDQFERVEELTKGNDAWHVLYEQARLIIQELKNESSPSTLNEAEIPTTN